MNEKRQHLLLALITALLAAVCWYAGKHNEWHWSFAAAGVSFCVMLFSLVEALFVPGKDE